MVDSASEIQSLRSALRRSRSLSLVAAAAVIGVVAGAALPDEVKDTVRAHRVEIVGDNGETCATLSSQDGAGHLTLLRDKRPMVTLGAEQVGNKWAGCVSTLSADDRSVELGVVAEGGEPVRIVELRESSGDPKVVDTQKRMLVLRDQVDGFKRQFGRLPPALDTLTRPTEENQNKPYIENPEALNDGWGQPFKYQLGPNNTFEIVSYGSDGAPGGTGDAEDISTEKPTPR
jgi:hypothetical protein